MIKRFVSRLFTDSRMTPWSLLVLAFAVRLPFLGRAEMWCDEINFAARSSPPLTPWGMFIDRVSNFSSMAYMPLPGMIHNIFLWMFTPFVESINHAAFLQRLPAAMFGAVAVPMLYKLGCLLGKRKEALAAALMLCCFFFPFFYSRDARFYSTLLFFTLASGIVYIKILDTASMHWRKGMLLFLMLLATALSMLNGVVFVGSVFAVSAVLFCLSKISSQAYWKARSRVFLLTALVAFLVLFTISPLMILYMIGLAENTVGQVGAADSIDILPLMADSVGKMLMGANRWSLILSISLLVIGLLGSLWAPKEKRPLVISILCITALCAGVLWVGVAHNKYYFSRIFYLLTAYVYLLIAIGIHSLVAGLERIIGQRRKLTAALYPSIMFVLISIHLFLYVLPAYSLYSKHRVTYRKVADWINTTLPNGIPVLIDEFHEQRYIPTFFPVPGRSVLAVPKVKYPEDGRKMHGPPLVRLLQQFPELCWVETWGSHGPTDSRLKDLYGLFNQKHTVESPKLRTLASRGILPQSRENASTANYYKIRIWYNKRSDVLKKYRQSGRPLYFAFDGWKQAPVARQQNGAILYANTAPAVPASVDVFNVQNKDIKASIEVHGAIMAPRKKMPVRIGIEGGNSISFQVEGGTFWTAKLQNVLVPASGARLQIRVASAPQNRVNGILVQRINVVESEFQEPSP